MYDFLIGLTFDEAIAELDARGIYYDFGECTEEEAREEIEIYIGGLYHDGHWVVDSEDGQVVTSVWEDDGYWD